MAKPDEKVKVTFESEDGKKVTVNVNMTNIKDDGSCDMEVKNEFEPMLKPDEHHYYSGMAMAFVSMLIGQEEENKG